ncbi:MAG TPA: prepilin peptidase [Planctomycetota bacterium]|nr:prepilin peptidase [Planctomycetota bacterium]
MSTMNNVPPAFWIFASALLGAIFGSFTNMLAYRLPRGISTWKRERSFCPKCEHQLAWYDNIPILSYLSLRGKCRYCRVPIARRYLLTELAMTALFVLSAYQYFVLNKGFGGMMPAAWFALQLFLIVDLVTLSVVDLEVWLIPIETTLYWIPLGFLGAFVFPDSLHPAKTLWWNNSPILNALIDSFCGVAIGAGFLWTMNPLVAAMVFVRNKLRGIDAPPPEAMGLGDVHMLGLFGALVGWKLALLAILFGVFIGAFVGLSKISWNKIQRARLGDKWVPPPPPKFDLPDDGKPPEPMLWTLPVFGVIVLIVALLLNGRFVYIPGSLSIEYLAPYWLLLLVGVMLLISFPFYHYLKSIHRLPGGTIEEGKVEVYEGNYIPFGPSLAAGCLIVVFWDPLLRAFGAWFFAGTMGAGPAGWSYHVVGERFIAPALISFFLHFTALFGAGRK